LQLCCRKFRSPRDAACQIARIAKAAAAAKAAAKTGFWTIQIVERSSTAVGFEVLPKRWIVERTFAWLSTFPAPGTRFRALRQNRRRLHPPRHDPHHAEAPRCKLLVMNRNFADGL
jgi:transposase